MEVRVETESPAKDRLSAWMREMFQENAMMDEATRFVRQFLRTGGDTGKGANIVILGIMGLFYLWFIATMIRFDMSLTIPLEYAELVLVTLVTPASIYAAISGEREKATWDALILTRLTPAQIIVGKVAWRVAVILLIMAVMLVAIFVSQFMGKDPFDRPTWPALLVAQAMILAWGVLLAAFSLWVSSRTKQSVTTISAVVGTMLGTLLLFPTLLGNFGLADSWERSRTLQEKMAFYFICANPFLILWMVNGRHVNASEAPPLQPIPWAIVLTVVYAVAAALFLSATHRSIRKLEEPIQKS